MAASPTAKKASASRLDSAGWQLDPGRDPGDEQDAGGAGDAPDRQEGERATPGRAGLDRVELEGAAPEPSRQQRRPAPLPELPPDAVDERGRMPRQPRRHGHRPVLGAGARGEHGRAAGQRPGDCREAASVPPVRDQDRRRCRAEFGDDEEDGGLRQPPCETAGQ
jgi:hypothetical protein